MKFHILVTCDNAAFGTGQADIDSEILDIIRKQVVPYLIEADSAPIVLRDTNGNAVGSCYFTEV